MQKKLSFLYESKSKIGWAHGLLACISALICAYLTMMILTNLIQGDYATRIIPSIILTPILTSIYGLLFLFAPKLIIVIKRVVFFLSILSIILILSIKVI